MPNPKDSLPEAARAAAVVRVELPVAEEIFAMAEAWHQGTAYGGEGHSCAYHAADNADKSIAARECRAWLVWEQRVMEARTRARGGN